MVTSSEVSAAIATRARIVFWRAEGRCAARNTASWRPPARATYCLGNGAQSRGASICLPKGPYGPGSAGARRRQVTPQHGRVHGWLSRAATSPRPIPQRSTA